MGEFLKKDNKLIWRFGGEKLVLEPWGENSIRVRARMMHDIADTNFALLPVKCRKADIDIQENTASLVA